MKKTGKRNIACIIALNIILLTGCGQGLKQLISGDESLSGEKEIISFYFPAGRNYGIPDDITGTINESCINSTVPFGTDTGALIPEIEFIGMSLFPESGEAVDFSSGEVIYTVTAYDQTTRDYLVNVREVPEDSKDILSFRFLASENAELPADAAGTVNGTDIEIVIPYLTEKTSLIPDITINGVSVYPPDGAEVDFSSGPVIFTVTAADSTTKDYSISVIYDDTEDYEADWGNFVNIEIDGHTLSTGGDVTGFPLLVRLCKSNFPHIASLTKPGGADIRFAGQDGTHLYYEIEEWVDNKRGTVWVLVDNISASAQTVIKMYYNNPAASSRSKPEMVFDTGNNFAGVWHLDEAAMDEQTTGTHADATLNGNSGAQSGNDDYPGVIGQSQDFDGTDSVNIAAADSLNMANSDLTVSLWVKSGAEFSGERLLFEHGNGWEPGNYQISTDAGDISYFSFYNGPWVNDSVFDYTDGAWHYLTGSLAELSASYYIDGVLRKTSASGDYTGSNNGPTYIGSRGGSSLFWEGAIDEVRVSNRARSADWI